MIVGGGDETEAKAQGIVLGTLVEVTQGEGVLGALGEHLVEGGFEAVRTGVALLPVLGTGIREDADIAVARFQCILPGQFNPAFALACLKITAA